MTLATTTVSAFLEHVREPLKLSELNPDFDADREIDSPRIQTPGLVLAGHPEFCHPQRVQILAEDELSFLQSLPPSGRVEALFHLMQRKVVCILVSGDRDCPPEGVSVAAEHRTAIYESELSTAQLVRNTLGYLDDLLSPRCTRHGVLLDVDGVGVLITGRSGIGKSECALDLVSRGHRLVADDVVEIRRRGHDLVGQASEMIQNLIEVRGLGVLDVAELYGVAATRLHKRIELHVHLETWTEGSDYDRLGLTEHEEDILGLGVRSIVLPVQPGRNVAGIVEVAARNLLLRWRGHHAAQALQDRMQAVSELPSKHSLRSAAVLSAVTDHIEDEVE